MPTVKQEVTFTTGTFECKTSKIPVNANLVRTKHDKFMDVEIFPGVNSEKAMVALKKTLIKQGYQRVDIKGRCLRINTKVSDPNFQLKSKTYKVKDAAAARDQQRKAFLETGDIQFIKPRAKKVAETVPAETATVPEAVTATA